MSNQAGCRDAAVKIAAIELPFSAFASEEAAATFASMVLAATPPSGGIAAFRAHYGAFNDRLLADMLRVFNVDIAEDVIGAVPVHRVKPRDRSVEPGRILINLHGGA